MTPSRSPKRPTGAPGVKMLIAAAALAFTLGGWAALTVDHARQASAITSPPPTVILPTEPPPAPALSLPPLPTIMPPRAVVLPNFSVGSAPLTMAQPTAMSASAAPPVLRVVDVPPAPQVVSAPPPVVVVTASSK